VTTTTIAQGVNIPEKEVTKIMQNGLKNITYDLDDEMVFVHHFLKYNRRGRPDRISRSIEIDFESWSHPLWHVFKKIYPAYCENLSLNSIKDKDYTITITKEDISMSFKDLTKSIKNKYLDYIYFTDAEKDKLDKKYGSKVERMIEVLNNYIGQSGKKYKSHYHAMLGWVAKEVIGDIPLKEQQSKDWMFTCKVCRKVKDSLESDGICKGCKSKENYGRPHNIQGMVKTQP